MTRTTQYWILAALGALAVLSFGASLLAGSADLPLGRSLAALWGSGDELANTIVRTIRLPRSLSAFAVGSLLALAGVLLQALFRNPLADPFVLGVSGGAAVGALGGMLLGLGLANLQWSATAGALLIGALVMLLGRGAELSRLLLSGVVLASACGALTTVLLAIADNGQLRGMVCWLAGELGWALHPARDLAAAGLALLAAVLFARALNVLSAGELRSADHRLVAPGAALVGGALLCLADIASRTVAAPRQLPVGAITALIGAPVFLLLLRRRALR